MSPPVHREVAHLMGMPISLALRGRHAGDDRGRAAWADALAELREVDRVFSTYRHDSCVSRLDRGELSISECPAQVAEVLALGEATRVASGGAFDVRRPGPDGRTVLDPSGVVKGWAVDRAVAPLLMLPDTDVCLSAGGDMFCHVAGPASPDWRIGIEHPHDPSRLVAVLPVRDGGVATSGFAHRGAHVVDARTGRAPTGVASVTVVAEDLTSADLDATAALALGPDAVAWLTARGRTGLVVRADGVAVVVT